MDTINHKYNLPWWEKILIKSLLWDDRIQMSKRIWNYHTHEQVRHFCLHIQKFHYNVQIQGRKLDHHRWTGPIDKLIAMKTTLSKSKMEKRIIYKKCFDPYLK